MEIITKKKVITFGHLDINISRYLLLLDSIRQCEGVAKLLQNSSGKEVPVKPARGNNKVAPGGKNIWKDLENILTFQHFRNPRG